MNSSLVLVDLMPRIIAASLGPHSGNDVLERCLQLAEAFRGSGRPVTLIRVDRPNVTEQPPGSGFADGLEHEGDIVVVKNTIGAFYGTDLHEQLQRHGIKKLVFAGLVTNMGVESTARAASDHGYEVEFVSDAMSGFTAEEHEFAVDRVFPRFGPVNTSSNYLPSAD